MKKIIKLFSVILAILLTAVLFTACAEKTAEAPSVKCYNGTFVGSEENGVLSFKGIPFAKAPIGELRWKAPQSVEASTETFDATSYGKVALQPYASSEPVSWHPENMSEDCLTLNIWTTGNTETKKPVMFWMKTDSSVILKSTFKLYHNGYELYKYQRQQVDS